MPILQNPRHERFAQELASGKTQGEAYIAAGYKVAATVAAANACRLLKDAKVSGRVAEIHASWERAAEKTVQVAAEKTGITKASVIQMLLDDREFAYANSSAGAAVRAAELLGKELGMFIDRKEVKRVDEFESMGEAELRAYIVEGLGLGLAAKVRGTRH